MKKGFIFFLAVIALAFTVSILLPGCFVVNDAANAARTISKRTLDGDNIIFNYEWFHSTYTDIQAKVQQYNNYSNQITKSKNEDMQNRMLVEQNGTFAYINDLCEQYNAKSKMINRSLFKDRSIPAHLSFSVEGDKGFLVEE